jgi:2-oxoisovalerate dehydrogenase E2 component (dihydrolipoyl transacylase)
MSTIVRMPQLGESVVEGTVARWLKGPGDPVAKNQPLLEISTDKIDTEVPAPAEGLLLEIRVAEGTTVKAGAVLATIGSEAEYAALPSPDPSDKDQPGPAATKIAVESQAPVATTITEGTGTAGSHAPVDDSAFATRDSAGERPNGRSFVSPVVARMAAEHKLDLSQIPGTGLGGRVTKKDVSAYLQRHREEPDGQGTDAEPADLSVEAPLRTSEQDENTQEADAQLSPDEILTPLTAMRRAIAQHMVMSKRTSPHVTTIVEADMTAVIRHREAHKRSFAAKGIALTYTPYFVAAIVAGLRAVPEANSRFTAAGIAVNKRAHIGIAVALAHGLLVPVLRDADEKNLQGLARLINELVERTRSNSLQPGDVQGGTFTLTNHGTGGSLLATPIINQPQTGILGVGAIVKRPVVRTSSPSLLPDADDSIVIRPMCYLSLTFDHRVLDGAQGDAFLTAVKHRLENWQ